jgi:hypothetical protein
MKEERYVIIKYDVDGVKLDESPYSMEMWEARQVARFARSYIHNLGFEFRIEPAPPGKPESMEDAAKQKKRKEDQRKIDKNGRLKHL